MSGEILRAVLTKSCIFSAPSFYNVEATVPATIPPILTARLSGKSNAYFLIMGVAPYVLSAVGADDLTPTEPLIFTVKSPITSRVWTFGEQGGIEWGKSLAGVSYMPEYGLIEPDELLNVEFSTEGLAAGNVIGVNFIGIEYRK